MKLTEEEEELKKQMEAEVVVSRKKSLKTSKTKAINIKTTTTARDEIVIPQKIERPTEPYVIAKMRNKSFMSEKIQAAIRQLVDKVNNVEKEQQLTSKEHIAALEAKVNQQAGDIFSY